MKGIIGAICGDIIGSTREFNPIKTKEFELFAKYSTFTDDTVLTLAVASWLVNDKEHHRRNLVKEIRHLTDNYPHAGYGGRFRRWTKSEKPHPYNSWGNGSAMRVSPVGWACNTLEDTQILAKKSAEVTHNHPEGIKAAVAVASAIYLARKGKNKEHIKEYIEATFNYDLSRKLSEIRPDYKFEVSCQKSVPESIICFLESTSYEDCIRNAISLGGDSDTMAAISGSIAAAYYEVPEHISSKCIDILDARLYKILEDFNLEYLKESEKILSNVKGDVPFESINFDNGVSLFIEYILETDGHPSNYNGKYTSPYRKISIIGIPKFNCSKVEENPHYNSKADTLNDEWQKSNAQQDFMDNAIQIIDEGLELEEIRNRIIDDEGYMVVLWKKGEAPFPVDLGMFKEETLKWIDRCNTLSEVVFNVLNNVND